MLYGMHAHPLASSRGELLEHRAVLYAQLGSGTHPCHWCGMPVTWRKRLAGTPMADSLGVDHLDGNGLNNDPSNLVASCQPCNVSAGYRSDRITDDEPVVMKGGMPTRASDRTCRRCGSTFLAAKSESRTYCSQSCANEAKRVDVCRRGHPRTPENTYYYGEGKTRCRPCANLASQRFRAKS